jgi:hypothetical protein
MVTPAGNRRSASRNFSELIVIQNPFHYVCSFQDPKGFSVEKPRLCEAKPFGSDLDKKTKSAKIVLLFDAYFYRQNRKGLLFSIRKSKGPNP